MRFGTGFLPLGLAVGLLFGGVALSSGRVASTRDGGPLTLAGALTLDDASWRVTSLRELPEGVNALATHAGFPGQVFVGTGPKAGVYKFNADVPLSLFTFAQNLGDLVEHGTANANRLEVRDLDGDGVPELLASTSQIFPRGRPKLFAWDMSGIPKAAGMARPEIRSSWSHGLAFLPRSGGGESAFVTYCGFGEIVEFQRARETTPAGFTEESMRWKQVGQLPASGEWLQSSDADNDGRPDLAVATGFSERNAAIHLYDSPSPGADLVVIAKIEEDHRFGNVRFVVDSLGKDGRKDVVAWWCTAIDGGDCEMIRYRLAPGGSVERRDVLHRGPASTLWPDDGQYAVGDLDRDGSRELWFATRSGHLWKADPNRPSSPLRHIAHLDGGLGPIALGPLRLDSRPTLLLAWGTHVLSLDAAQP